MKILTTILLIISHFIMNSQNEFSFDLENDIEKNILIYRIINKKNSLTECYYGNPSDFDRLLPSINQKLNFLIKKADIIYPNKAVSTYIITTKFNFIEEIKLKDGFTIKNEIKFHVSDDINFYHKFLIGYDKQNDKIIYISGDFFKNCISEDFNLDEKEYKTFIPFLEIKLFNYEVKNIRFNKKSKKHLLFTGYSNVLQDDILIRFDRKNFDAIQIKSIDSNWTDNGSYQWKN